MRIVLAVNIVIFFLFIRGCQTYYVVWILSSWVNPVIHFAIFSSFTFMLSLLFSLSLIFLPRLSSYYLILYFFFIFSFFLSLFFSFHFFLYILYYLYFFFTLSLFYFIFYACDYDRHMVGKFYYLLLARCCFTEITPRVVIFVSFSFRDLRIYPRCSIVLFSMFFLRSSDLYT